MSKPHITRVNNKDDYETPRELFELINKYFQFDVDAAASDFNFLCPKYYTKQHFRKYNVFAWENEARARIWCNPPFSDKEWFLNQACRCRNDHAMSVFLLPNNARETIWWKIWVAYEADVVITLRPRVNYCVGGKPVKGVTFPSCLAIYYPRLKFLDYGPAKEVYWDWKT